MNKLFFITTMLAAPLLLVAQTGGGLDPGRGPVGHSLPSRASVSGEPEHA